jgi:hypothetical protein
MARRWDDTSTEVPGPMREIFHCRDAGNAEIAEKQQLMDLLQYSFVHNQVPSEYEKNIPSKPNYLAICMPENDRREIKRDKHNKHKYLKC